MNWLVGYIHTLKPYIFAICEDRFPDKKIHDLLK